MTLNLGIVAHVDAGKTSLTERLLFERGIIRSLGSVDAGNTQTDSMQLEKERGITIQSAVVSFEIGKVKVNLIDTPGHSDFIAEVERALRILDAVILVISAVEGVQPQTRVLMRTLQRLQIPVFLFVNKIDRKGAQGESLLEQIRQHLTPKGIVMNQAQDLGFPHASVIATSFDPELVAKVKTAEAYPVFFGSAITGAGISTLIEGIACYFPVSDYDPSSSLRGTLFKIERDRQGEKIAYIRLYSGKIEARDTLTLYRKAMTLSQKVTRIHSYHPGMIKVWGLDLAQIGDHLHSQGTDNAIQLFSLPTLKSVIESKEEVALYAALRQLAEQDPLINAHLDPATREIALSLYGEVQKEVIQSRLALEFGIQASFKETKTIYIYRIRQEATALHEIHRKRKNEFFATIGLKITPGEPGTGIVYRLDVPVGDMPKSYHVAVKEGVIETLRKGINGWEVTDCIISLTACGLCPLSTACDFRHLTPILIQEALEKAEPYLCEPIVRFDLEIPLSVLNRVIAKLIDAEALIEEMENKQDLCFVRGTMPANRVHGFEIQLPGLSQGSGMLFTSFAGHTPCHRAFA